MAARKKVRRKVVRSVEWSGYASAALTGLLAQPSDLVTDDVARIAADYADTLFLERQRRDEDDDS